MLQMRRLRTLLHQVTRNLEKKDNTDSLQKEISFLDPPPDGGWGWVVVLAASTHALLVSGFHSAFGVYMVSLLETFKSSSSRTAWIGSLSYGFIMIFGPVSGKLLQKYGAIKVAVFGALIMMAGVIFSSFAHDISILFLTHGLLVGIGSSFAYTPGMIMVSLYFTTKRSFATGIVMAGGAAGTLVQNQVHRYLIRTLGWRTSLRVFCGILAIGIFAGFAYRPLEKRRHPSVVENFQTSPLRGFIVDLRLWKNSVFEIWVCALGLAKFGFFIPFVHMMKLANGLGISLDDAPYIMVGTGISSLLSCLFFGKICDSENINRLFINQASVFCVGNYVLLPVLTLDLMGAEKMPVAWGFMMAVNAISCFGPPFAGWIYDMLGSYNIGFVVPGLFSVGAAGILAFIPRLKKTAVQEKKNIIHASVCEITSSIIPWGSSSVSEGTLNNSETRRSIPVASNIAITEDEKGEPSGLGKEPETPASYEKEHDVVLSEEEEEEEEIHKVSNATTST
ncbi:PREDICTED: monocarboxylate transporter 10-like isoform X2 [Crocodylus porosus]|uniref:monocarboxylate transporter 10-like isoform X2 n=1 Tax=Crocodylus porosus TaxID=8502 RepID=UPI000938CF0B|nr:PREDICTED: monocarboxylate transporter 10-like isoform X2 [Crocodylus porosus]